MLVLRNTCLCSSMLLVITKYFRVVHQSFRRSIETMSRHFHQSLVSMGELRDEMIRGPSTAVHHKILASQRWNPYFRVSTPYMVYFIGLIDHGTLFL